MIIYLIQNRVNGKVYVGQTRSDVDYRFYQHLCAANWGSELRIHQAIRKYGIDSFSIKILWEGPIEEVNAREIELIAEYKSMDFSIGYNMSPGGYGISDERREQISRQMSGMNNHRYGKPGTCGNLGNILNAEQRKRISLAREGKGRGPCRNRQEALFRKALAGSGGNFHQYLLDHPRSKYNRQNLPENLARIVFAGEGGKTPNE